MCTVTFSPIKNGGFILVSNRDIPFSRAKADIPKIYFEDEVKLCYPKDGKAGGSWIGLSDKSRLICLLNGGFDYHTSLSSYKKSRGQIVKELLKKEQIELGLAQVDLDGVEQFTLVIVEWKPKLRLFEFVWDGTKRHLNQLDLNPRIWSSSTLYDPKIKLQRESWFKNWIKQYQPNKENLYKFHETAGVGDPHIDLVMDRGQGGTVSISCVQLKDKEVSFSYKDVTNDKKVELIYE